MSIITDRLARNARAMADAEPYFAERYELARRYTAHAKADNGGLHYPDGYVAGPNGCTCTDAGHVECIHAIGWRLYTREG